MARWGCQDCPALYGAWLSRCPRCGSAKELVVALWACTNCTTKYAVGLPRCPHCGSTDHVEDGQPMPKNTVHGGPSSAVAEPTQPGYMPPAEAEPEPATGGVIAAGSVALVGEHGPEIETLPFGAAVVSVSTDAVPEGGEESSPGTSSSASTEAPPTKSEPNETPSPARARTTARRSKKAPTDSSSAGSTAGEKTEASSASDGTDS